MLKNLYKQVLILLITLSSTASFAQNKEFLEFINKDHPWVDSIYESLSNKERIAQLFLVRSHTNLGQAYIDSVHRVIEKEKLGGLVVFQGGPTAHVNMFNKYQQSSDIPLLISFDGEWGLGMRLADYTLSFPFQLTLGAVQNNELIYQMGKQIAKEFQRMGMHFNFAPVVDINNNPKNPVIGFRSFGDDKYKVTEKAGAYMQGMIDGGILTSIKHFPGHGDTDVDSHFDLPQLNFSRERLDTLELYPFKELIAKGAQSVMVGHMHVPVIDDTPNIPTSISEKAIQELLINELGFNGLVVTDAMDMEGVKKNFPNGQSELMAYKAGVDLIEVSEDSERAINLIENSIQTGETSEALLARKVKKVLATKLWLELHKQKQIETANLYEDLNSEASKKLFDSLALLAVTLLNNEKLIDEFNKDISTAIVQVGGNSMQAFEEQLLNNTGNSKYYHISEELTKSELKKLLKETRKHPQIVLAIHDTGLRPRPGFAIKSKEINNFVSKLAGKRTISVLFSNPYSLDNLPVKRSKSILMAYQNDPFMQEAVEKILINKIPTQGKLPVNINKKYKNGMGL